MISPIGTVSGKLSSDIDILKDNKRKKYKTAREGVGACTYIVKKKRRKKIFEVTPLLTP